MKSHNIIAEIYKNVRKVKWCCLHDNCGNTAINSHLAQRKGILNELIVDGHLIQLKVRDANVWNKEAPFGFKKIGIDQAISGPIFCDTHDSGLFKELEENKLPLDSYKAFLLFSYRTLCAEIRKKEIGLEQYRRVLRSSTLEGKIDKDSIKQLVTGSNLGIRDLTVLKEDLNKEIANPSSTFSYFTYCLPRFEIFASAVMSVNPLGFKSPMDYDLDNLYIHIIPRKNTTLLLTGFHNKYYSDGLKQYALSWSGLNQTAIELKLSTLLTYHLENWVMSPKLFGSLKPTKISTYLKYFERDINHYGIPKNDEFNLFE